ncbi:thioredoxin family protein [Polaribacter batillariae]|uniref:Thioredoxin family protein n=1 Tax=Polaribacter batillariae TaxID=2808900 RepID=A0ABX7SRB6_9FLAO|nr:thioredoxin family protein [Polaribacter batillariae]QTD36767.1 thioredoxin family protein [Polaribacter batillariae]
MKNALFITLLLLTNILLAQTQTLKGTLEQHKGQKITLAGFNYYKVLDLATTVADSLGNFSLNYPKDYKGMGVLKTQDNSSLVVVLTASKAQITGTHLKEADSLQFINSPENNQFVNYAKAYTQAKQAYKAWRYLKPKYTRETTLKTQKTVLKNINKELQRLERVNSNALKLVSKNSYLRWFLPIQTLVNNMPETIHNYRERLPKDIKEFRSINFNNPNFKTSGLFKELIEGHYFLLENMGQNLDSVFTQMNISTDYLINNLKENNSLLNNVSEHLFKYFEKRSLYPAAAHLSNQMLSKNQCVLSDSLANTMQKYKDLKVGNTAPNIQLDATTQLSDIKKPVLLVFGASWCSHCKKEALELLKYYDTWKTQKKLEVVYISLDTDQTAFKTAYQNVPWQTYCDYKGWETQAAKKYYVNATPTYFLLDKDMKILVHPRSLAQVDAWINYKL